MIGIFDSGIGGLSFVKEVRALLPEYDLMYLGDTARVPYGPRSPETIKKYAEQDLQFLLERKCQLIIVACNTIASTALRYLQQKYSNQHILGVLIPAVEHALAATKRNVIGVVGTNATVASNVYEVELKKRNSAIQVIERACPLLVPLIEEGYLSNAPLTRKLIKTYVRDLKDAHVDTLILGCTHYPLVEQAFKEIMGRRVTVINSSRAAAEELPAYLARHPEIEKKLSKNGTVHYYVTEASERFQKIGAQFLRVPQIKLEKAVIE